MTLPKFHSQRGAALLIALIVVALATLIAVGTIERGQSGLARTQALLTSERSYQYALGMDILAEELIRQAMREDVDPALLDGAWTPVFDVPGGLIQGRLIDQNARFNVNALGHPEPALAAFAMLAFERLLERLGLDPVIALELADWIEGAVTPRPGSAGDSWYAARQPPYRMAGQRLAHVTELRWLRSVDDAAWERLRDQVVALPEPELRINVNTTSPEVLASLFETLEIEAARRVVEAAPFNDLTAFLGHPVIAPLATPDLQRYLTVFSPWYLAQARVVIDDVERDYFRLIRAGQSGYDFRWFSQGVP
ncbi:MAG: type II secretion system minor pseudopilin GspK [Wenzhouxiangella sp.]|jgi:general secretion pathway protein K|nr:type II secretion system minor pseudopilin GspK [Wenzhouxiangella sp.]